VALRKSNRQLSVLLGGRLRPQLLHYATIIALLLFSIATCGKAQSKASSAVPNESITDSMPTKIDLVDGSDLRFRRLSADSGLSQTRAAWVVQDKVGFIWFGTQYGLNRYDGYKSKVFKHEPGRPDSLISTARRPMSGRGCARPRRIRRASASGYRTKGRGTRCCAMSRDLPRGYSASCALLRRPRPRCKPQAVRAWAKG